jgi:hypothetical protein
MITVILNMLLALTTGVVLTATDVSPWYWSILWGLLVLISGQVALSFILRKKMASISDRVQGIMKVGQAKMQAKMQRWRVKPVGSPKAAEQELAKDRDAMIAEVQAVLKPLEKYRLWVPLLGRQLATMELQFAWQRRDYKRVDTLLPRALLIEPFLMCIRLARLWQQDASTEDIRKAFEKMVRRARYGTTALVYATFAWVLVKRGDVDAAYKVLVEADEKNEHPVIKANKEVLANNKLAHFTNVGFGDEWYALWLEEPKMRAKRMRDNGRFFM